jgi:hypothetical protein
LVLATPTSGPALMWTPQWVSLEMELPTVLVIPTFRAPFFLQYLQTRGTDRETSQEKNKNRVTETTTYELFETIKIGNNCNFLASAFCLETNRIEKPFLAIKSTTLYGLL